MAAFKLNLYTMYITLSELKQHLVIDSTYNEDDLYLTSLIEVAEETIENHINRKLNTFNPIPNSIKHAMLLLIGNFYNNREAVVVGVNAYKLPLSYDYLLAPYINYLQS